MSVLQGGRGRQGLHRVHRRGVARFMRANPSSAIRLASSVIPKTRGTRTGRSRMLGSRTSNSPGVGARARLELGRQSASGPVPRRRPATQKVREIARHGEACGREPEVRDVPLD